MSIDRNHLEMNAVPAWHASAHGPVSADATAMAMSIAMSIAIEKPQASDRTRCAFTRFQVVGLARDGRSERRGAWRGGV